MRRSKWEWGDNLRILNFKGSSLITFCIYNLIPVKTLQCRISRRWIKQFIVCKQIGCHIQREGAEISEFINLPIIIFLCGNVSLTYRVCHNNRPKNYFYSWERFIFNPVLHVPWPTIFYALDIRENNVYLKLIKKLFFQSDNNICFLNSIVHL